MDTFIVEGKEALFALQDTVKHENGVENFVDATMQLISQACDETVPRKKMRNSRQDVVRQGHLGCNRHLR